MTEKITKASLRYFLGLYTPHTSMSCVTLELELELELEQGALLFQEQGLSVGKVKIELGQLTNNSQKIHIQFVMIRQDDTLPSQSDRE
ncbi:hypothetical protein CAG54_12585 [Vibrio sp. V27_P1S3P104]|uniref:hypothetical protein n=1 Tax=unclassified Vibrio TaxID=2614977 RepID=UPI0013725987|nr:MULTISPECIES: hypothetical protein [unclassified Vibrio]NAW69906.1 hypothetical protein [Vibrio sp. V28_P6S34P95]NAX03721.1 hypothetical protein [Vibrio sp. V30_P3S12P165]NAX34053.1 hypothetical protein [Vibrio sp. V29_P1S30P107]NAX38337.1 hypothetical protein [Vibrio sp. V27_P1S3P104]